jgi:hypothetical protein
MPKIRIISTRRSCFIIVLTYLINKSKPIENQISKKALRDSLMASGLISFGIWSIQFIIFEMYISRLFEVTIIKQDLRVEIILILGIFIVSYFNLLRIKFLPETAIKSKKKILEVVIKEKAINNQLMREKETTVNAQDLDDNVTMYEDVVYLVESVSYKLYFFLMKKLRILPSLDESTPLMNKNRKIFKNIIVALLWIIVFIILSINFFQLLSNFNPIFNLFFVSVQYAFFIVLIDFSIMLIFNRFIPFEKRIPRNILRDSIFIGGIILLWILVIPLFFIYYYFFMGIYQIIISDFFSAIISSIIIFIMGSFITRWLSSKKGFNTSLRKTLFINLIWFVINLPLGIFFVNLFGDILLNDLFIVIIDIAVGSVVVMSIYNKPY